MDDHYRTLGVDPEADASAIRAGYLAVMRANHPDHRPGDEEASEVARSANLAYEVLRDPTRRAAYDRLRLAGRLRSPDGGAPGGTQAEGLDGVEVWRIGSVGGMRATVQANPVYTAERERLSAAFLAGALRISAAALVVGAAVLLILS